MAFALNLQPLGNEGGVPNKKYRADTPAEIYGKWRTWQMSDHSPLWIRIETNFTDEYLNSLSDSESSVTTP